MTDFEGLYWLAFASCAIALLALERIRALQRTPVHITHRWGSNIGLFAIGSVVSALLLPIGIFAFAAGQSPGLMMQLGVPFGAQLVVTFLLLDLWKYWEHRVFHGVPLLWRCHLVHHSDTDVDVTTTERHHPLEVLIGAAVLIAVVALLRPPAAALGVYLVAATAVSLYSHANVRMPTRLEDALRPLFVTPAVHAVHHSSLQPQTDSNFGMVLTLWDRLFGTFVDPQRTAIRHFGLDYFHRPDDTTLWRVLQQPFRFRRDLVYPARDSEAPAGTIAQPRGALLTLQARNALLAGLAALALLVLAMSPTLLDMARAWRSSEAYQYAWLVVPMVVYMLVWHRDDGWRALDAQPGWSGVPIAMIGGALWGAAWLMSIDLGQQLGLVIAVHGVALATLGWSSYRRAFAALALLFLMVPATDLLLPALRVLTVKCIAGFSWAAAIPHSVDGFVVHIGAHRYIVIDECAGLAYVTLGTFLGYCFGLLLYGSVLHVAGMALVGGALGVLSNVVRVNAIVLIDWLRGAQMDLASHGTLQWIGLIATLGGLLYLLNRANGGATATADLTLERHAPSRRGAATKLRLLAPVAAALAAVLIGAVAVVQARSDRSDLAVSAPAFPDELTGWRRVDSMPWQAGPVRATRSAQATYAHDARRLELVVIQAERADAKPPDALPSSGEGAAWREKQVDRQVACAERDCMGVRHVAWLRERGDEVRHAYVAYGIDGVMTDSRLAARALHGWHRLLGSASPPALLAVTSDAPLAGDEVAVALRAAQAAMRHRPASSPE